MISSVGWASAQQTKNINLVGPRPSLLWLFLLIHTLLWTLGPSLLRNSLPHDTLEGLTWGLQWQLGYNKHPFLTAWLLAGIANLFPQQDWSIYLLAQLVVSLSFWATWKLAKQILPPIHALVATLALDGILFYNINSFNLTPDTLQTPLWALLTWAFYNALNTHKQRYWLYTGVLAALSICTKYQVLILLFSMFMFCIMNTQARLSFKKPGIYLGLTTCLLLISPHLIWLYQNDYISLLYAVSTPGDYTPINSGTNHFYFPMLFVINNLGNVFGLFVLLWPFYPFATSRPQTTAYRGLSAVSIRSLDPADKSREVGKELLNHFQWQFLLYLGLGPCIISIVLCLITGNYFPPRWSTPYYFSLGILVVAYLSPLITPLRFKQFLLTLVIFSLSLFIIRMSTLNVFIRSTSDAFLPNQAIATQLNKLWTERFHSPIPILAGSNYLVTSVTPYIPYHPIPFLNWNHSDSPWIKEGAIINNGALFIWDKGKNYTWDKNSATHTDLPTPVVQGLPTLQILPDLVFYRSSDNSPIIIGVALVPPMSY